MIYDTFKLLCKKKGVSMSNACVEMGFSRSMAYKWKSTSTNPSADVLSKMADYFGVTVDYILGGTTPSTRRKSPRTKKDTPED